MKFMKIFTNYIEAQAFAILKSGRITVEYDWDEMTRTIVRHYIVKF